MSSSEQVRAAAPKRYRPGSLEIFGGVLLFAIVVREPLSILLAVISPRWPDSW